MFGVELSLGDREDFSSGKPGCSVAARLEENRFESVHIKGSQELLGLLLFQMEPLWNYREDNAFPSR